MNKVLGLEDEVLGLILRTLLLKACVAGTQCNSSVGERGMRA